MEILDQRLLTSTSPIGHPGWVIQGPLANATRERIDLGVSQNQGPWYTPQIVRLILHRHPQKETQFVVTAMLEGHSTRDLQNSNLHSRVVS